MGVCALAALEQRLERRTMEPLGERNPAPKAWRSCGRSSLTSKGTPISPCYTASQQNKSPFWDYTSLSDPNLGFWKGR